MTLQTQTVDHRRPGRRLSGSLSSSSGWKWSAQARGVGAAARHVASRPARRAASSATRSTSPGIIDHWKGSTHAAKGVGCVECHQADERRCRRVRPLRRMIATVVTPRDCGRCHQKEYEEFEHSHHAKAGNILASLDNFLAETVEGSRVPFNPHSPTPGHDVDEGQRHGERRTWLPAVPRQQGGAGGDRRRPDYASTTSSPTPTASRPTRTPSRKIKTTTRRPAACSRRHLAQHGHRPAESRRLARLLLGLPLAARLLAAPGPAAGELRQVPPRSRSSAEGDLRRIEARRRVSRSEAIT